MSSWATRQYERKKLHQVLAGRKGGAMKPRKSALLMKAKQRDARMELRS